MSEPTDHGDYWPCACTKRDKAGNLTHVKMHYKTVKRCRVCKCERPPKHVMDQLKSR